jgi:hypothetical protein
MAAVEFFGRVRSRVTWNGHRLVRRPETSPGAVEGADTGAGEVTKGISAGTGEAEAADVDSPQSASEDPEDEFIRLKEVDRETYERWVLLTRALLESVPLCLDHDGLREVILGDYGVDVSGLGAGLNGLVNHIAGLAFELTGYLSNDTANLVYGRLGLSYNEGLRRLSPEFVDVNNTFAADRWVRNEILAPERTEGELARLAATWGEERGCDPESLLLRHGHSLGGRLTERACCAQVRQAEYLLSVDDVMKSVAYFLARGGGQFGCKIVAVAGTEVVLEVPRSLEGREDFLSKIRSYVEDAQEFFLGELGGPCDCEWVDEW